MKKKFLTSLVLFSSTIFANVEIPEEIPTTKQLIERFRTNLKNKIVDLEKNYIKHDTDSFRSFTSHKTTKCNKKYYRSGMPLAAISYHKNEKELKSEKKLTEIIGYYDCGENLDLQEIIVTFGDKPTTQNVKAIKTGNIDIELKEKERIKDYKIIDSRNEQLFRIYTKKYNSRTHQSIYVRESLILEIETKNLNKNAEISFYFHPYRYEYFYRGWGWRSEGDNQTPPLLFKQLGNKNNFYASGELIAKKTFRESFEENTKYPFENTVKFIDIHLTTYPKTEVVSNDNGAKEKFINELRLTIRQLKDNNTQPIIKYLDTLMKDVKNNKFIIDDRREK